MQIIALETVGNGAIHRLMRNNFGPQKRQEGTSLQKKKTQKKNEKAMLSLGLLLEVTALC